MQLNSTRVRRYLKEFDFKGLFLQDLGWDRFDSGLPVVVGDQTYVLNAVAEKRNMVAFVCEPGQGGSVPDNDTRSKIERKVADSFFEHLIIFVDTARTTQVWQWVKREAGKTAAPREHTYHRDQPGDSLIQKLQGLAFVLAEEESLTLPDVTGRVKAAFDVESVTEEFFKEFEKQHAAFLKFMEGIQSQTDREWYASLMLNRLMFIYFIQRKEFLNRDKHYLSNQLREMQERFGQDKFYSFYRTFLLRLFHDGLASQERPRELVELIGEVPYLNGGLFDPHELERVNTAIDIPDKAFEAIFKFFDEWHWHLDERPLKNDREINPDVLGYIFEKYINQQQKMGAYYTKEDITEYISKNTIIPFLFDKARDLCEIAFRPDGAVWQLLRDNPDLYIYPAVKHGLRDEAGQERPLPDHIAAGLDRVAARTDWNRPAPADFALPTEIWREVVARRRRYGEVRGKLAAGEVTTINDLITLNLNITKFALDAIQNCGGPELLRAFYTAIRGVTVLDPTCGSGAFLFAALNILEPLYKACLRRMEIMVVEADASPRKLAVDPVRDFRPILAEVGRHPSRRYFILRSIIINNLYGVDIMEEAVEIAKLRLFLKLVAQLERAEQIEPLPDIDFNIRAGNTLVGFATQAETNTAIDRKFDFDGAKTRIDEKAKEVARGYESFRQLQTTLDLRDVDMHAAKHSLQINLDELRAELDRYLAGEYSITTDQTPKTYPARLAEWQHSHQPFHWWVEFYSIMHNGGFDVIIGNPPYVKYSKVKSDYTIKGYSTESTGNLYSFAIERSFELLKSEARFGMIVPIASISTEGMKKLQELYGDFRQWHSSYAVRPGKLFVGVDMNLTISLLQNVEVFGESFTTSYRRWSNGSNSDRPFLFSTLNYVKNPAIASHINKFPKLGSEIEAQVLSRMIQHNRKLKNYQVPNGKSIFYHSGGRYWRKALLSKLSSHYKPLVVSQKAEVPAFALLNSQLFYWYWIGNSNCMDVVSREVLDLPVFNLELADSPKLKLLTENLIKSYYAGNSVRQRKGERINVEEINFDVSKSKPIIDEIDRVLAAHYGFSEEELDFIINYDIKYRMGRDSGEGEGEE